MGSYHHPDIYIVKKENINLAICNTNASFLKTKPSIYSLAMILSLHTFFAHNTLVFTTNTLLTLFTLCARFLVSCPITYLTSQLFFFSQKLSPFLLVLFVPGEADGMGKGTCSTVFLFFVWGGTSCINTAFNQVSNLRESFFCLQSLLLVFDSHFLCNMAQKTWPASFFYPMFSNFFVNWLLLYTENYLMQKTPHKKPPHKKQDNRIET